MQRGELTLSILLLLVVTFVAFLPCLNNGFTNWDDQIYVTENPKITSVSWQGIKSIFGSFHFGNYQPLVLLSYAVEYQLAGLRPWLYHTTNLMLHLINCLLVFWLVQLLTRNRLFSLVVALLFALHPLRVEPVAWVTGRKDLLYALFFLGALISYLYFHKRQSLKFYYLSLVLLVFSLLSKPMAVTLPLVLFIIDYFQDRKADTHNVLQKVPFLAIAFLYGLVAIIAQHSYGRELEEYTFPLFSRFFIACYALLFYLVKAVIPVNLSSLYAFPETGNGSLPPIFRISPLIVAALALIIALTSRHTRGKHWLFGILFFLVTIFPVLQLLTVGKALAADRFSYLPSLGLFFVAAAAWVSLYRNQLRDRRTPRILALLALCGIMAILFILTWSRCLVWKDSVTLWTDTLRKNPRAKIAYLNRGGAYLQQGDYERALADFTRALEIDPEFTDAYNNRGNVFLQTGELDKAIADYDQALSLQPTLAKALNNRGVAFKQRQQYDKALADFAAALRINPAYADAYYNRGNTYNELQEYDKAIADFTHALTIDASHTEAYNDRGMALKAKGDLAKAIDDYSRAIALNPHSANAYYNRGNAYLHQQAYDQAISDYTQALTVNPQYAEAFYNRGLAHEARKAFEEAIADYTQAIAIRPEYTRAYYSRALVFYLNQEFEKAWQDVRTLEQLGYQVDPELLTRLRQASPPE